MKARLPPIITSVARMIESGSECRQPYTLSNLDLVTQSLTLIAGNNSSPLLAISFKRWTPVVVSSLTPLHFAAILVYLVLSAGMESFKSCKMHLNSALSVLLGSGRLPSLANFSSYSLPLWDQECCVTSIIYELIAPILPRHCHHLLCAPPVLCKCLTLPSKNCGRTRLSNRSRGMILSTEDVARTPAHCSTQFSQSLDEHSCLDRHVQRSIDIKAFERLARTELLASCH